MCIDLRNDYTRLTAVAVAHINIQQQNTQQREKPSLASDEQQQT